MLCGLLLERWVDGHRLRCGLVLLEGRQRRRRTCGGPLGRVCLCWGRLSGLGGCWRARIFRLHFDGWLLALVSNYCQRVRKFKLSCSVLYFGERWTGNPELHDGRWRLEGRERRPLMFLMSKHYVSQAASMLLDNSDSHPPTRTWYVQRRPLAATSNL